ncbi:ZRAB3-like protein [Mya arenaria]|uniref:ZRAB3-like protein n=1 Tax=Mya arenaria TaxID=6604 RepID=A0ABY7FA39_MYAAR|nr:ZRAB3-like protein [Mya arenaria]
MAGETDTEILSKLPPKLLHRLMPFQKKGVLFAVRKNGRCLIADEMGLGKTLQAISVSYYYRDEWPLLIIVPSSLRYCWIEEFEKWLPDIDPADINLVQSGSDVSEIGKAKVTITTFGLLSKATSRLLKEALFSQGFQVVIVDESHYIRNVKTASAKTVVPLIKNANRRVLLSGTPALSRPVELYPQIDAICPDKFGSWWHYTARYCDAKAEWIGKVRRRNVNGASNLEELQHMLASTLMIRREKSQVLTQLPPKQRQKEIRQTFDELRPLLKRNGKDKFEVLTGAGEHDTKDSNMLALVSRLYQLSGEAKIGPAKEYIEMLCENPSLKFLVFAYHHAMMNGLSESLHDKHINFIRIDGDTPPSERPHLVHKFQSDPETRVAVLSILAAGVTIVTSTTLTGHKRQMEAAAGNKYQVDVLSNADVWVPSTISADTSAITQCLQAQLEPGQKSIRSFFSPGASFKAALNSTKPSVLDVLDKENMNINGKFIDVGNASKSPARKRRKFSDSFSKNCFGKADDCENDSVSEFKPIECIVIDDEDDFTEKIKTSGKHRKGSLKHLKKSVSNMPKMDLQAAFANANCRKSVAKEIEDTEEPIPGLNDDNSKGSSQTSGSDSIVKSCEDNGKWSCAACTFLNHKALLYCEVCETPNKEKPAKSKTLGNVQIPSDSSSVQDNEVKSKCAIPFNSKVDEVKEESQHEMVNKTEKNEGQEQIVTPGGSAKRYRFKSLKPGSPYALSRSSPGGATKSGLTNSPLCPSRDAKRSNTNNTERSLCRDGEQMEPNRNEVFCTESTDNSERREGDISNKATSTPATTDHESKYSNAICAKQCQTTDQHDLSFGSPEIDDIIAAQDTDVPEREEEGRVVDIENLPVYSRLSFQVSRHTGRVYLHGPDGAPLHVNFVPTDVESDVSSAAQQKAKDIGGTVRLLNKPAGQGSNKQGETSGTEQMLTNTEYIRDQVYEAEHGVCQMCKLDAHALYRHIKETHDPKKRAEILGRSLLAALGVKVKQQMVLKPTPGLFWHADHIVPVWQGGGQCDIDNLRTLCVCCHNKVTAKQAGQRANVRRLGAAVKSGDITAFFQKLT